MFIMFSAIPTVYPLHFFFTQFIYLYFLILKEVQLILPLIQQLLVLRFPPPISTPLTFLSLLNPIVLTLNCRFPKTICQETFIL